MAGKWRSDRALRAKSHLPGRPEVARREDGRRFWALIAAGQSSEDAAVGVGVSQPVGSRWFREAGGMPPSTLGQSSKLPSGRYLSLVNREEIALWRVQGWGTGDRPPAGASSVDGFARAKAQCRDARWRAGVPGHHGAVACRAGGTASEVSETGGQRGAAVHRAGPAGWSSDRSGRGGGSRADRALEGPSAWAAAEPAMGQSVEPGADCSSPAARLPR